VSSDQDRRERFQLIASEVYEPLQRYLRRRVPSQRAEDTLADVMMTVWRRIDDIPTENVLPWCYGVARLTLANERRGQERHLKLVARLEAEPRVDTAPDPAETGPDPELETALAELSDDEREVVRLWAWEQLEPREIAPVLGITVNAATLRLSRARKRLGDLLGGQNSADPGHEPVEGTREQL
jgi:RNA polymerase sigma-70 factor, ECF subfamily